MGRNRFVDDQETVRVDISDGDWIELKARLSFYDQNRLTGAGLQGMKADDGEQEMTINWPDFNRTRIATWLVGWSFRDAKGKAMPVNRANIDRLDSDTAEEILAAIEAHATALEAEKAAKNGKVPTPA